MVGYLFLIFKFNSTSFALQRKYQIDKLTIVSLNDKLGA